MTYFVSCFVVALLATLFIMRSSMRRGHLSADHDLSGPQKVTPARYRVWVARSHPD